MNPRMTIHKLIEQSTTFVPSGMPYEPHDEARKQDAAFRKFLRMLLGATEEEVFSNFYLCSARPSGSRRGRK